MELPERLVQRATDAAHRSAYPNRIAPTDPCGAWNDIGRATVVAVLRELDEYYEQGLCNIDSDTEPCLCTLADQIECSDELNTPPP